MTQEVDPRRGRKRIGLLITLLLSVFFLGFLYIALPSLLGQQRRYLNYVPVEATIQYAGLKAESDNHGGLEYQVNFIYEYRFGGELYRSANVWPEVRLPMTFPTKECAEEVLSEYPVGKKVTAYCDPHRPVDAFLIRQYRFSINLFILVPTLFFLFVPLILGGSPRVYARNALAVAILFNLIVALLLGQYVVVAWPEFSFEAGVTASIFGFVGITYFIVALRRVRGVQAEERALRYEREGRFPAGQPGAEERAWNGEIPEEEGTR